MPHASLIGVLIAGFGLALVFGTAANRLRLSPIAGYSLAGIAIPIDGAHWQGQCRLR
jgi:CPA2 family monovalent cation:H+ antiporter-2